MFVLKFPELIRLRSVGIVSGASAVGKPSNNPPNLANGNDAVLSDGDASPGIAAASPSALLKYYYFIECR